jgi:probable rRNA maturation factor
MISLTVNLDQSCARWKKAFPRMKAKISEAAAMAVLLARKSTKIKKLENVEINILLANDSTIKKLNRDFRGIDKATNVLSFPSDLSRHNPSLGDIILASGTIKRECKVECKTLENHTIHLVVHGVLHLLGYDHMRLKDAKVMEKLECDILAAMGYPDPYHEPVVKKSKG